MTTPSLYDCDLYAWTQHTIALLQQGQFQDVDVAHLIEELDSMGRRDRRELISRLKILLAHLLKWHSQPTHRCGSWRGSILEQRLRIRDVLQDSPSLHTFMADAIAAAYTDGVQLASKETGLPPAHFPLQFPYSPADVLNDDWFPM